MQLQSASRLGQKILACGLRDDLTCFRISKGSMGMSFNGALEPQPQRLLNKSTSIQVAST